MPHVLQVPCPGLQFHDPRRARQKPYERVDGEEFKVPWSRQIAFITMSPAGDAGTALFMRLEMAWCFAKPTGVADGAPKARRNTCCVLSPSQGCQWGHSLGLGRSINQRQSGQTETQHRALPRGASFLPRPWRWAWPGLAWRLRSRLGAHYVPSVSGPLNATYLPSRPGRTSKNQPHLAA